jgi:hypothetical protein
MIKSQLGGRNYQFSLREPPIVFGADAGGRPPEARKVSGSNSENEAPRLEGERQLSVIKLTVKLV